jgi:hypothetical protein
VRKKKSPFNSPSMLGLSPLEAPVGSGDLPPPLELPASATGADGRRVSIAPVPRSPPSSPSNQLLGDAQGIGPEESYSRDEVQLNNFLKLHPMLSMGAPQSANRPGAAPAHPAPCRGRGLQPAHPPDAELHVRESQPAVHGPALRPEVARRQVLAVQSPA